MLHTRAGYRLDKTHIQKLQAIREKTGLTHSQIVRSLIESFDLAIHANVLKNEKPATGLVHQAETVSGFATMN